MVVAESYQLLTELSDGGDVGQRLQLLISSLRKQVDCLVDLNSVRYTVWEALYLFAENMQVPTVHRMYVLELLHSMTGGKEGSGSAENLFIQPWEGWADSFSLVINESVPSSIADTAGMSEKFANTLVALKSNEIISVAWPGVEITPNDLSTVQSAVSCFSYLATSAVSETHIDSPQHLLGEWEELFSCEEDSETKHEEVHGDNWVGDGWEESWERFEEDDPAVHDDTTSTGFMVHPLHACWRIVLLKLIGLQHFLDVVKCVDRSLIRPKTILLDEDEARDLSVLLISIDPFVALKVVLLLPYSTLWFDCLPVDAKLKGARFGKAFRGDYAFVVLMLSSGVVSTVMTDTKYRNIASYLCYSVGFFMRIHQEYQPGSLKSSRTTKGMEECPMFAEITLPYFVAELLKAKEYLLAGVFVMKFMHVHSSMAPINVAELSLRKFITNTLERSRKHGTHEKPVIMPIVNSITKLREKLPSWLDSGLLSLSTDVK